LQASTRSLCVVRHHLERRWRRPDVQDAGHGGPSRGRGPDAEHGRRLHQDQRARSKQARAFHRECHRVCYVHHGGEIPIFPVIMLWFISNQSF